MYKKISVIISLFIFALAIYIFIESFLNKKNNEVDQSKEMIQYIVNTAEHSDDPAKKDYCIWTGLQFNTCFDNWY